MDLQPVFNFKSVFSPTYFAAVAVMSLAATQAAQAGLLAYEGFAGYTNGSTLESQALDAGSGWTSNVWTNTGTAGALVTSSTGLTYGDLAVSGGSAGSSSGERVDIYHRNIDMSSFTPTLGGEIWMSALVNLTLDGNKGWSVTLDDGTGSSQGVGFGAPNFNDQTASAIIQGGDGGPAEETAINTGTNYYVTRITFDSVSITGDPVVDLWVNPLLSTDLSLTAVGGGDSTYTRGYSAVPNVENIVFYSHQDNGITFDEIRVGTSMGDVMVIPEPSTYVLFLSALSALYLVARRRRA